MASVFLSYDHEDAARAGPIASALENAGHSVWWDRYIHGGAEYNSEIENAVERADAVVVLWSERSVKSAWVRDEAAEGRDQGKLVPVRIDRVKPPMGFRQFQTIDLVQRRGKARASATDELLRAIETLGGARQSPTPPMAPAALPISLKRMLVPALALFALILPAAGYWFVESRSSGPPRVAVAAADPAPLSQEMARDMLVKLAVLQGTAATNVRLLDAGSKADAALRFDVNGAERGGQIHANVTLISSRGDTVLWSKEFEQPSTSRSDLEDALAFAAARVLGCAIEEASGKHGRLSQELRRVYLIACATLAEVGSDNRSVLPQLRRITVEAPRFRPAWALLLNAQSDHVSFLRAYSKDSSPAASALKEYIQAARNLDPGMAEATLAELSLNRDLPIADAIALLGKAKAQDPHNPAVLIAHSKGMERVGRMTDSVDNAAQAAELDPVSPYVRAHLINALLYSGQIDRARAELARAKQLWPGTKMEFAIELRAGDFEKAVESRGQVPRDFALYAAARRHPSDANVARYLAFIRRQRDNSRLPQVVQALGEMNRPDEFYALVESIDDHDALRTESYVLFRPWVAPIRRDLRFIQLAKRLGLVAYWRKSGKWPDFCFEPDLSYDCKQEAAKLAA